LAGDLLTIVGAGNVEIAANQSGDSDYQAAATVKRSILVEKASQSIEFTSPKSPVTFGVKPFKLLASASSGLTVQFKVISGPGKLVGDVLTITAAGTVKLQAGQGGSTNYLAAQPVSREIEVEKASQTIAWSTISGAHDAGSNLTLHATASSGLAVSFATETPKVCSVSKDTASLLEPGTCTIHASQAGNLDFDAAPTAKQSFAVSAKP
jgi:hypothetical protein